MVFSGMNVVRRMTSGSSSSNVSSESTPLLNGSHEGPCYAYSYANHVEEEEEERDIAASVSTTRSSEEEIAKPSKSRTYLKITKIIFLSAVMMFCVISLSFIKVRDGSWNSIALRRGSPVLLNVTETVTYKSEVIRLRVKGPFLPGRYYSVSQEFATFAIDRITTNGTLERVSKSWKILLAPETHVNDMEWISLTHDFKLLDEERSDSKTYQLSISTNKKRDYVTMYVDLTVKPKWAAGQIVMALCVLIGLYVLIIFELVHRTLAAMMGATTAIACLAIVGERPSLKEVLTWIDVETLCLLFGMMVLVSILCETGFFDYVAVITYKIARGQVWALIAGLCLVTAVLSAFLDNVTTVLLMSAVAIRLCEAMNIDPKHMLILMVVFSNIGGAATPVGDPPNVIIISNSDVEKGGIGFGRFTAHMLPVVLLCTLATFGLIKFIYRDAAKLRFGEPPEVVELKHEIEVWKKALNSLPGYSKDEDTVRAILQRKIAVLETLLRKKLYNAKLSDDEYRVSLKELTDAFKVKDRSLLLKSGIVIGIVIVFFFLESIPQLNLSLGWIAILGAIFLLVLGDFAQLESILSRVEWSTLLFFAALFVVMEALSKLDLVWYIVNLTQDLINSVDEGQRLMVALILILWTSALCSSIIDNIPFTTIMVQVVVDIANTGDTKLPLAPLVFALALGSCFGGNGTLIGASANVVTAGLAEQHGYRFSFVDFFKVGFPIMILTTSISTGYLLICHVWFSWNT